jgi:nucleoside-triphosphatase THEP1
MVWKGFSPISIIPGRYGVDFSLFEAMALPALAQALREQELVVIDEIGEMGIFLKIPGDDHTNYCSG